MSNPTWFSDRVLDRSMHLIRGSAGIVAVVSVEPEYGDKEADNIAATMAASADMVQLLRRLVRRGKKGEPAVAADFEAAEAALLLIEKLEG